MSKFIIILDKLIESEIRRKELGYKNKALNVINQDLKREILLLKHK